MEISIMLVVAVVGVLVVVLGLWGLIAYLNKKS